MTIQTFLAVNHAAKLGNLFQSSIVNGQSSIFSGPSSGCGTREIVVRILLAAFAVALAGGCARSPHPNAGTTADHVDLTAKFAPSLPQSAGPPTARSERFVPRLPVVRRGRREEAIVLVAPVSTRAMVPESLKRASLEFLAAPVFNLGDGFQLDVVLSEGHESRVLHQKFFDPGRNASDRDWIEFKIPVELRSVGPSYLELRITAGPQRDETGDWLAVARPRLVRRSGD